MSLPLHLTAGSYVGITTSRADLNQHVWRVVGHSGPDRVLLYAGHRIRDLVSGIVGHRILVSRDNVHTLALVPYPSRGSPSSGAIAPLEPNVELDMLPTFVRNRPGGDRGGLLTDVWLPLPLLGGNFIKLLPDPTQKLFMYPALHGYQVWFYSRWNGEMIMLTDCDVLKQCPQKQVWPWCSYCSKFLLPAKSHRRSRKHERFCYWLAAGGASAVQNEARANMARSPWLGPARGDRSMCIVAATCACKALTHGNHNDNST